MIKVLGKKRILLLAGMLALNVIFGAILYLYLIPEKEAQEASLNSINSQVRTVRSDLEYTQQEFEQLETQRVQFDKLNERGFFDLQKRRQAEEILGQIQKQSDVIAAKASIGAGKTVENEEAAKAEHIMLESPISIAVEALDDVTIYNYIYLLQNFFPGHLNVEELSMKRNQEVTGGVLKAIATNKNPPLVMSTLRLTWRTMIPKASVIQEGGDQP